MESLVPKQPRATPQRDVAGLYVVEPERLTWRRVRRGRGFSYHDETGRRIEDSEALRRIRSLAIPPAYEDVRIAAEPRAHLQAIGRDEAGRLQYRYHPDWEIVREHRKVSRLAALVRVLPRIRNTVARDLRRPTPCRRKALAAAVALIDRSHIRIGSERYVQSGRTRGAATLLKSSVRREGDRLIASFRGKRGHPVSLEVAGPALIRAIDDLMQLPGRRLFQYRDEEGRVRKVSATDVNQYLAQISGALVSSKDFRTLAATSLAAGRLCCIAPASSATGRRRQIAGVIREIAELLGNTPAVARKSYVHRCVIDSFEEGSLSGLEARCLPRPRLSRREQLIAILLDGLAA